MKIEIDANEFHSLKKELEKAHDDIYSLKEELNKYNPEKFEKGIEDGALSLFQQYLKITFEKLGFNDFGYNGSNVLNYNCRYQYRKWTLEPDLNIKLGAQLTEEWKRAFLNIGVTVKENE